MSALHLDIENDFKKILNDFKLYKGLISEGHMQAIINYTFTIAVIFK